MAGGGSVLEDASVLSKLDRGLAKAEGLFALLAGLTVFVMMLLINQANWLELLQELAPFGQLCISQQLMPLAD